MLGNSGQNNTFYLHAVWQFINRFPTWYFIYASYNLGCRNYLDLTCEQLQLSEVQRVDGHVSHTVALGPKLGAAHNKPKALCTTRLLPLSFPFHLQGKVTLVSHSLQAEGASVVCFHPLCGPKLMLSTAYNTEFND